MTPTVYHLVMPGSAGRASRAAFAMSMLCLAVAACSSTTNDNRDCGYSVTFNKHVYVSLIYALRKPLTRDDVIEPEAGSPIGQGFVPQCPGDSTGEPATVYAIGGVSPDLALMAATQYDRRPILCIREGRAIPAPLLTHP